MAAAAFALAIGGCGGAGGALGSALPSDVTGSRPALSPSASVALPTAEAPSRDQISPTRGEGAETTSDEAGSAPAETTAAAETTATVTAQETVTAERSPLPEPTRTRESRSPQVDDETTETTSPDETTVEPSAPSPPPSSDAPTPTATSIATPLPETAATVTQPVVPGGSPSGTASADVVAAADTDDGPSWLLWTLVGAALVAAAVVLAVRARRRSGTAGSS